jgi:hypothetical protein
MKSLPITSGPLLGLGMTSLVLGTIGLLITIFPILSIPLTAFGLLCGVIGFFLAMARGGRELRWSLAGIGMCTMVLALDIAIALAPSRYLPGRNVPELWRQDKDRPYVPPPR